MHCTYLLIRSTPCTSTSTSPMRRSLITGGAGCPEFAALPSIDGRCSSHACLDNFLAGNIDVVERRAARRRDPDSPLAAICDRLELVERRDAPGRAAFDPAGREPRGPPFILRGAWRDARAALLGKR